MAGKPYSHASHINRVLRASKAKYAARLILCELCRNAEFDRPETSVTKPRLMQLTGYTRRTVQTALQWLREEGSIVPTMPLEDFVPGRGRAVTYRLCVAGQGGQEADTATGAGQDPKERDARLRELLRLHSYGEARRLCMEEGYSFN